MTIESTADRGVSESLARLQPETAGCPDFVGYELGSREK